MKVLVINGSPKNEQSNTLKLTKEFLLGLEESVECDITIFEVYNNKKISPCCGCYNCWTKTPGTCIFDDDMPLKEYIEADLIVWSFPLYYYGVPSQAKCLMDRLLPTVNPTMVLNEDGSTGHPPRYDFSDKRYVLISTCGFYKTEDNFEALTKQFELLYDHNLTSILCPQGELFRVEQLHERCNEYLEYIRKAGQEYGKSHVISPATVDLLNEKLFAPEVFLEMANADWDISGETNKESKAFRLLKQMSTVYNKDYYSKDVVFQFNFTDTNEQYQLLISKENCKLVDDSFLKPTTSITTTLDVWQDISKNKITGSQAIFDGLYTVDGDFKTMTAMDNLFSTKRKQPKSFPNEKNTNMNILLFPFIAFWVSAPFSAFWGGIITILVSLITLTAGIKFKLTSVDYLSIVFATIISILSIDNYNINALIPASYIVFGCLWGVTCLLKIPLTAYYSLNEYDRSYLDNPIFIKTNRILTASWALLFILMAPAIYLLITSSIRTYTGVITPFVFSMMGLYTNWFKDYYPAAIARKQ